MTKSVLLLFAGVLAACKSDITDKQSGDPTTPTFSNQVVVYGLR